MERDHPNLVQHSQIHTQALRANGDISLILRVGLKIPVNEIIAVEKYVSGYACKGNEPTGAVADLFNDMVNSVDETTGSTTKSLCTKLLMGTVKRDISAVETSFELSALPIYRSNVERANNAAQNGLLDDESDDDNSEFENICQPEWIQVIKTNSEFIDNSEFKFDDGGPDYSWSVTKYKYPADLGVKFIENLKIEEGIFVDELSFNTDINISSLNEDQMLPSI
ncbi:unnamed protein product [Mytilus edulis]|uniref:Uncharacterized protein n=1 Tax=Mytilus edulis TaxID=6550 RepID=A0A8S3R4M4_MYTED|nr:unnamed protein product [Mytilus edulis]